MNKKKNVCYLITSLRVCSFVTKLLGFFPLKKKKKKIIGLFVISKTEDKIINIDDVKNLAI